MLFKRRARDDPHSPPEEASPSPATPGGAAALRDELGLHQPWYLDLRLKEELARAARADRVFSLATWEPRLLPGDTPDPEIIAKAARLIASKLRSYDLVGRIADQRIAALLLDADYHHASTVAYRIKADIQVEIPGAGKWKAGTATFGRDGVDGDSLIQVALRRMDDSTGAAAA
jgi:hypothetical protein